MKIDGLMSLQGIYDNTRLGMDYQSSFRDALTLAQDKRAQELKAEEIGKGAEEKDKENKALREAVQGFESYFIHQILKQARASLPSGGLLPSSNDKEIYEDMLDEARAEQMTKVGGFGLTEALMKQLSKK